MSETRTDVPQYRLPGGRVVEFSGQASDRAVTHLSGMVGEVVHVRIIRSRSKDDDYAVAVLDYAHLSDGVLTLGFGSRLILRVRSGDVVVVQAPRDA